MPNNMTKFDAFQVLRSVYDIGNNSLRVTVVEGTTGGGAGFEVIISATDDSIRLGDGTQLTTTTLVGIKVGLDVNVLNEVNIEDLDASKDNVAIHDSAGDELNINADGSINVSSIPANNVTGKSVYAEIVAVAANVETTIVSFMTIGGRRTFLQQVVASGDNIAKYKVKVNGTTIDFKRTMFGSDLNAEFKFDGEMNPGLEMTVGDTITVTVTHPRPSVGNFNAKIQYVEVL